MKRDLKNDLEILTCISSTEDNPGNFIHDVVAVHALERAITAENTIASQKEEIEKLRSTLEAKLVFINNGNETQRWYQQELRENQIESLQKENVALKNDLERIHERVEEALADQPDNYASFLAVEDIKEIVDKWAYPALQGQGDEHHA